MLLLCFYLGGLGVHRFYAGKIGTGVLMLLTSGGFGIWLIIDFILICLNRFTDSEGQLINKPCNLLLVLLAIALPAILILFLVVFFVFLAAGLQ
jgi:TM2 domain-containing membrane protein YozV